MPYKQQDIWDNHKNMRNIWEIPQWRFSFAGRIIKWDIFFIQLGGFNNHPQGGCEF